MADALLFMTVMTVACAVVVGSSGGDATGARLELQRYADDFTSTLLAAELEGMEYRRGNESVAMPRGCVARLIFDEAMVLEGGEGCDFSGYNARLLGAARALLRPGLGCAMSCGPVLIGGEAGLPADRCASQMTVLPEGGAEPLTITVYVWVI
jgi:hypothetical protein